MRSNFVHNSLKMAVSVILVLLLGASVSLAQQEINLTAGTSSITLPDGSQVPMWGYTCGAPVTGSTATCSPLNPAAAGWSPVVITVPSGQGLRIHLTNNLPVPPGAAANQGIPTSLTIVGQLGGGLGTAATYKDSPVHAAQQATWPVADPTNTNTPPPQGQRVQSFATEVATGATVDLTWGGTGQPALNPGTYLFESGTHPSIQGPMGLYGMLVVTTPPSAGTPGTAYPAAGAIPAVTYSADVPLLMSEIDPVQNQAVSDAVATAGFSETMPWSGQPGGCGNSSSPTYHQCYPPVVNYTPLYYLFNGVAFDKTHVSNSQFPTPSPSGVSGNVLVRLVNAGLRMHIPSIVGAQTGGAVNTPGFGLIAEDGNPLPGVMRVQSEVFMAPGKTYDVMINTPAAGATALPIYDRQLSLSGNATSRDAGMLAYISVNGASAPGAAVIQPAVVQSDTYNSLVANQPFTVSDVSKGVIANDTNVFGVQLDPANAAVNGTVALNTNGTFTFTPSSSSTSGSFGYCANGSAGTLSPICTTVTLGPLSNLGGITCTATTYTASTAKYLDIKTPGVLANCKDSAGYPLTVDGSSPATLSGGGTVLVDENGGFTASVGGAGSYTLSFTAKNSVGKTAAGSVTLDFPTPNGPTVTLVDGLSKASLDQQDYRWIIEEDRTFFVDPHCQINPLPTDGTCPTATPAGTPAIYGTNFHSSYMPVVAQGCTGALSCETGQSLLGQPAVCDIGSGVCRTGAAQKTPVFPSDVALDPRKHYYISVLPGDAMDPGHAMGGAPLVCPVVPPATTCTTFPNLNITVEPQNQKASNLSVFVFEDDHPLNGEHDAGGGIDTLSPNEPGLGGFNITILDLVGMSGDPAGQMTYDEFNQPLSNALAGTIDPVTGLDACPVTANAFIGSDGDTNNPSPTGITGVIPVCPTYEADGVTMSPLAGQAIVANVPPGRYGIVATPAADRISRGEEWLQTNTLDGGKDHEAFLKVNEPRYFQEYGPASYHVSIGFANPAWINDAGDELCKTATCGESVTGKVSGIHMSRPSDERLYGSGTYDAFGYTQCYVSLGSPDGADIRFSKCKDDGSFSLPNIPQGDWKVTIFDQWNDMIVDGISTPVRVAAGGKDMGEISINAWKNNLSTRTCFDVGATGNTGDPEYGDGVCEADELGLSLVPTNIRYRDGSISNLNSTDLEGFAGFNEVFPIFAWYVMETDSTRYKNTGTHVINDAGGPVDGAALCGSPGFPPCGNSETLANLARTQEDFPLPQALQVPGARYCGNADCPPGDTAGGSTGRVDPAWANSYGWQSFMGQNQMLEFGKRPFLACNPNAPAGTPNFCMPGTTHGENGGIHGHVVYTSTRPFDDPALLLQLTWEPLVPHVTINLYQEGFADDGVTPTLKMVDTTTTSSWDDWAQGFYPGTTKPYMSCPGQDPADPFYNVTLKDQPNYLNWLDSQQGAGTLTALPNNSQYKCYDGMHNWNQLQPAPYDGMYNFPSILGRNPNNGTPMGTSCTICATGPDGEPILPPGKYVVEMIVPPGYELVKEEDKNILLGDTYEAPVTQQFAGFGNIYIMPDQASVAASYNANNPLIPNTDEGVVPRHEGDTGSVETFWPCVGTKRIVPDYMSLFPQSGQNAPFAGATRPLCDRKEVVLEDQMSVLAKFYVFTSAHIAAHFTGIITDDFTAEFDPFSPAFGEKFGPANLPVSVKDWAGNEISRVYSDEFGMFNGLTYSSFSVNPPDPSGYIPQMMVMCMNDRGAGITPDPFYQAAYSQFCYEWSFMPGQTSYLDTPVIPTAAFAPNYNHPDCAYPDATPAVAEVDGDGVGPWVSAVGHSLTINALGDQQVNNYAYSGPDASAGPFNKKTITRHYGFGSTQGTGKVTIGGVNADVSSWSDTQIVVTVPAIPLCSLQQQQQFGGPTGNANGARCGELVITADNGKQSVDAVTVTVGGKAPTVLAAGQTIQSAIDAADPGDLIIVPQGAYHELVIMWKPVRLQGVGAATTVIDANAHPSGLLLSDWRLRMVCLFGLAPTGVPAGYDPSCGATNGTPWPHFQPTTSNPQVDRLPLEATVGWDAGLNGNLAEQLQEPTLLGAYEGAGITVLSKGVRVPNGLDPWTDGAEPAGFPAGTALLTTSNRDCGSGSGTGNNRNPFPSNFLCNPSRIDGLSVTNSSQGGGGIYVHGWGHNLEIANNRVYNNQGTLAGGITVGQGEHPPAYLAGAGAVNTAPGSCMPEGAFPANTQLPYCFNRFVNVHNNAVLLNASEGDELFSATPSGAGGVAFCTGADNYKFNYNWVCGNLTTGDGAGLSHMGFVWDAEIQHNTILFNQGTNPTTPSNGGGLLVMSAPDTDPVCPGEPDADCNHAYGSVGDGIGRNLRINANLILGNAAEAGSGGGIRFQGVNGVEVSTFPNTPSRWYTVSVTNNIVANNVAGWDGGGVSLQDSIGVNLINNTIISNDSTATSGTLFGAFFASQASAPTPCPRDAQGGNIACTVLSTPQPAGVSAAGHTAEFLASLPAHITCPPGHPINPANANTGVVDGACRSVSFPELYNDVIWQNRAFNIVVTDPTQGAQQATVSLVPTLNQVHTGDCITGANYWDIGFRGDTGPTDHSSTFRYQPKASILSPSVNLADYPGGPGNNFRANQTDFGTGVVHQYCNGSKIPPEAGKDAWYVTPPGTNEGNVPVPVFSMTAGATVDEGNNWVNVSWGPLSLINPTTENNPSTESFLADYKLASGSTAINWVTSGQSSTTFTAAPSNDFFENPRKTNNSVDVGAVEFGANAAAPTLAGIDPASGVRGAAVAVTITGTNLANGTISAIGGITITNPVVNAGGTQITATFAIARNATLGTRNVTVTTPGGSATLTAAFRVLGATIAFSGPVPAMNTGGTSTKNGTITVSNTATAPNGGPFTFTAAPTVAKFGGAGNGTFSIQPGGTCGNGVAVATGSSCTINVRYSGETNTSTATGRVTISGTGTLTSPLTYNFPAN